MSTFTVSGPLRYCRCGHGEHEHSGWMHECPINGCTCQRYVRDRKRTRSIEAEVDGFGPLDMTPSRREALNTARTKETQP